MYTINITVMDDEDDNFCPDYNIDIDNVNEAALMNALNETINKFFVDLTERLPKNADVTLCK